MTMLPVTISGDWAERQRMTTVSQLFQMLSCSNGLCHVLVWEVLSAFTVVAYMAGCWLWPVLNEARLSKVADPSLGEVSIHSLCEYLNRAKTCSLWAGAAAVDELVDRVRVVVEVGRQRRIGERIAVVGNEVLEVGGHTLCIRAAHALGTTGCQSLSEGGLWRSEDAGRKEGSCNDEGAHFDWYNRPKSGGIRVNVE